MEFVAPKTFPQWLLSLFICLFIYGQIKGQTVSNEPDSLGPFCLKNIDTWSIHSNTIGEDYTLYVLRTAAYDTSNIRLPVLYMTDGDWNMTVAMNCFSMLRQDYTTHEPLIVGIGYGKGKNQRFPKPGDLHFLHLLKRK